LTLLQLRAQAALALRQKQTQTVTTAKHRLDWTPLPKQREALENPAFETLFGGAAGGGKSSFLVALARLYHQKSLLLRRTFPDLERSLIVRSLDMYGDPNRYNAGKHVWRWDGEGQRIEFGHIETEKDVYAYQSAEYDLIGFDELTQFERPQYEYMISRARTTVAGQRVRIVACTNPGGSGNDWVMERWAAWLDEGYPKPAKAGEIRWFKRDSENRDVETTADDPQALSRTFIPARLDDNPFLDDNYRRSLSALPEPWRSQLLHGDWKIGTFDDPYQIVPTAWIRDAQDRWTPDGRPGFLTTVGVDVARGGEDQTVLAPRYGYWFAPLQKFPGRLTPTGFAVVQLMTPILGRGGVANLDVIGIGAAAYDAAVGANLAVEAVNFSTACPFRDRSGKLSFHNLRAGLYWRLREWLDPELGYRIALPPDAELLGDLRAMRWEATPRGIKVLDKEDIKRHIGRSPDCADAVALALFEQAKVVGGVGRIF
jgi:hypothetical protein